MTENDKEQIPIPGHDWAPLRRDDAEPGIIKHIEMMMDEIPDLPVSVRKILNAFFEDESDLKKIADIVASDPVLTSRILHIVNSAYYGLKKKTDNIYLAIVLLGLEKLKSIALQYGISCVQVKDSVYESYDMRTLWLHSYLVSVCAETFSESDNHQKVGVLLTLGLVHDIGKYALAGIAHLMKERGISTEDLVDLQPDAPLLRKEENLFGVNHSIVGGLLARKWCLSESTCTTVEFHHYPSYYGITSLPEEFIEDITIVCLADLIVNIESGTQNVHPEPSLYFFEILGLTPPLSNIVTPAMRKKLEEAKSFLTFLDTGEIT